METYDVLKTIHVIAVVVWVGGALTINILGTRVAGADDPGRMIAFARDTAWLGERVFLPASVITLIMGVLATLDGEWGFGKPWIGIGFTGIIVTAVTGSAFLGPEAKRIAALAEARGTGAAEVKAKVRRILAISRIDLVILFVVITVMVVKPGS